MKRNIHAFLALTLTVGLFAFSGCEDSDDSPTGGMTTNSYTVTIENVSPAYMYSASGLFNEPVSFTDAGPIGPGEAYEFHFGATPGAKLSFATMFVLSNDLFYAPDGSGIDLFDGSNNPMSGDITGYLYLWDAGSEMNEMPGSGMYQPPNQSGPDSGPADTDNTVRMVNDGYTYPAVEDVIEATLMYDGENEFTVRIENVSSGSSLETPLAPGVFVVHTDANPLFTMGMPDYGHGLEALAEDGNPSMLSMALDTETGVATPLAPGVWVVHSNDMPLFADGQMDYGDGLENLAEDGDPSLLVTSLTGQNGIEAVGAFDTPDGASAPGVLMPGQSYSFTFNAMNGYRLSFATMFVQSNDLFYGFGQNGLNLSGNSGDVTGMVYLWDAGTEMNQWPGAGPDQAPRQSGGNTGMIDATDQVRMVNDSYNYPAVSDVIKVTLSTN